MGFAAGLGIKFEFAAGLEMEFEFAVGLGVENPLLVGASRQGFELEFCSWARIQKS